MGTCIGRENVWLRLASPPARATETPPNPSAATQFLLPLLPCHRRRAPPGKARAVPVAAGPSLPARRDNLVGGCGSRRSGQATTSTSTGGSAAIQVGMESPGSAMAHLGGGGVRRRCPSPLGGAPGCAPFGPAAGQVGLWRLDRPLFGRFPWRCSVTDLVTAVLFGAPRWSGQF
jgi:hypothetical protein